MTLRSKYQDFLNNPTTGALAANAALAYIPTLTVIHEPTPILKHLAAQSKQIRKKSENILSAVEGPNGLCVETETTLEFLTGGGVYLPALDDNFLADRVVTFPIVHIVSFDETQAISSIRLHWDQGSLLKQVEIIGSRARNWPIRDGKDQIRLIATTAGSPESSAVPSRRSTQSSQPEEVTITRRPHASSTASSNAGNEPRTPFSLFQPIDPNQERVSYGGPVVSPRASAKPASRNLTDILSGTENESEIERSGSPSKNANAGGLKGGAGKNYHPIRLFDQEGEAAAEPPVKDIKTDPKKFTHFEFGEPEMPPPPKPSAVQAKKLKGGSQWDFSDFTTPEKPKMKIRTQDVRHFGWSDDEETSPVHREVVHHPRRDAETHFEFRDDGTPDPHKARPLQKGRQQNEGFSLYKNNIIGNEEEEQEEEGASKKKPLSTIAGPNVDLNHRSRDFDAHYDFGDASPSRATAEGNVTTEQQQQGQQPGKKIDENRAKVLKTLSASWDLYDESPEPAAGKKENVQPRIKTEGNGLGGRKGTERSWGFGDEDEDESNVNKKAAATTALKRKGDEGKSFWDF